MSTFHLLCWEINLASSIFSHRTHAGSHSTFIIISLVSFLSSCVRFYPIFVLDAIKNWPASHPGSLIKFASFTKFLNLSSNRIKSVMLCYRCRLGFQMAKIIWVLLIVSILPFLPVSYVHFLPFFDLLIHTLYHCPPSHSRVTKLHPWLAPGGPTDSELWSFSEKCLASQLTLAWISPTPTPKWEACAAHWPTS